MNQQPETFHVGASRAIDTSHPGEGRPIEVVAAEFVPEGYRVCASRRVTHTVAGREFETVTLRCERVGGVPPRPAADQGVLRRWLERVAKAVLRK